MKMVLLSAGSAVAAWAGMMLLCLQSTSQRRRMGLRDQTGVQQRRFIIAATAMIAISLGAAVAADGVQFGLVLGLCQAGMLGLVLICSLPFAQRAVTASAFVAAPLAPLLLAAASWM